MTATLLGPCSAGKQTTGWVFFGCDQQQGKARGSARSRSHRAVGNEDTLTSTLTAGHSSSGTRLRHSTMLPGPITARFGCFGPCLQHGDTEGLHSTAHGLGDVPGTCVHHKGTASLVQQGLEEQGLRFPPCRHPAGFRVSFGVTARSQTPPAAARGAESRNPAGGVPPGLSSLQHHPQTQQHQRHEEDAQGQIHVRNAAVTHGTPWGYRGGPTPAEQPPGVWMAGARSGVPALYLGPPSGASRCGAAWPGRSWAAAAAVLQGRGGGGQGLSCRGGHPLRSPCPHPTGARLE